MYIAYIYMCYIYMYVYMYTYPRLVRLEALLEEAETLLVLARCRKVEVRVKVDDRAVRDPLGVVQSLRLQGLGFRAEAMRVQGLGIGACLHALPKRHVPPLF